jgi:hypothetical protein
LGIIETRPFLKTLDERLEQMFGIINGMKHLYFNEHQILKNNGKQLNIDEVMEIKENWKLILKILMELSDLCKNEKRSKRDMLMMV